MPRLSAAIPKYRLHRASGQAIVSHSGKDFYLGPYGTKASRLEYDRVIYEWLANGRQSTASPAAGLTVVEICADYKRHAEGYYRKNGVITNEVTQIVAALKVVQNLYGKEPAESFGSLKLEAVQQAMIARNWSRKHINKQIARIIRAFSWAVGKAKVSAHIVAALREVPGLAKGRCAARETAPVRPVDDAVVEQTLPFLPSVVADMVRVQRLTGCRPEDICRLRPCDVDRSGDVWTYCPETHKTEHQDRGHIIFLGPRAQAILQQYLSRPLHTYCFSPRESEAQRRLKQHQRRATDSNQGNAPGTNRKQNPQRTPRDRYTTESFRRAIHRGCELAFGMPQELRKVDPALSTDEQASLRLAAKAWRAAHLWSPNQLRHTAATEVRKKFGLEGAQVILGHAAANVTEVYAERDAMRGAEIMRLIG